MIWIVAYLACIPAANWLIGNVGTCLEDGPCVIPVGLGLSAPSGVLMIGAALVLRDMVQRKYGAAPAIAAILAGSLVSLAFATPALVVASAAAFLISELADMGVYTPLRRRNLALAVLASGAVGAALDSAVFLWLAFGSLDFIAGQIVGKLWATVAGAAVIAAMARRREVRA